jgi:hypothetical protein
MVVTFVSAGRAIATSNAYGDPLQVPSEPDIQVVVDTSKIIQGETR